MGRKIPKRERNWTLAVMLAPSFLPFLFTCNNCRKPGSLPAPEYDTECRRPLRRVKPTLYHKSLLYDKASPGQGLDLPSHDRPRKSGSSRGRAGIMRTGRGSAAWWCTWYATYGILTPVSASWRRSGNFSLDLPTSPQTLSWWTRSFCSVSSVRNIIMIRRLCFCRDLVYRTLCDRLASYNVILSLQL